MGRDPNVGRQDYADGRESLYLQLLLAKRTISLDNLIATNRITALLNCVSNF